MGEVDICSMWDSNYHTRGLALLVSLYRHLPDFHLYVLALDDGVRGYFKTHRAPEVTVIGLEQVETPDLQVARRNRTWQEYVWTLTPALTCYCLDQFPLAQLAYLDADCYLFADLAPLYAEVGPAEVGIIPHRWAPRHTARLAPNGIYNVSWVYFRANQIGWDCAQEWRRECVDWCYYRKEDTRFADQGYLNDWPQQHRAHVVQHLGADLAPWNQEQYAYTAEDGRLQISDGKRKDPLLFYHFHEAVVRHRQLVHKTNYPLAPAVSQYVYSTYAAELVGLVG